MSGAFHPRRGIPIMLMWMSYNPEDKQIQLKDIFIWDCHAIKGRAGRKRYLREGGERQTVPKVYKICFKTLKNLQVEPSRNKEKPN